MTDTVTNSYRDHIFARPPVRIGRNALNDLVLEQTFVSQFHAVLEAHDGQLLLRDLGSTNGTLLNNGSRVPPNQPVPLASSGYEFRVLTLAFRTFTANVESSGAQSRRRPLAVTSLLQAKPEAAALLPGTAQVDAVVAAQRGLYVNFRAAASELIRSCQRALEGLPTPVRAQVVSQLAKEYPSLQIEPEFQRLASVNGVADLTPFARPREEVAALEGLKDLTVELAPALGRPQTTDEIVNLLNKLTEGFEVFLRCFLPLRDGHNQFEADMAIRKSTRPPRGANDPRAAVEHAHHPQELAARLLDWRDPSSEAAAAVESTFADVMIHQVAMLNGVMIGVKSLLEELSPAEIEKLSNTPRYRAAGVLGRHKLLWKIYQQRYGDLVDEEKHVFSLLFGPQFAQAYAQYCAPDANKAARR